MPHPLSKHTLSQLVSLATHQPSLTHAISGATQEVAQLSFQPIVTHNITHSLHPEPIEMPRFRPPVRDNDHWHHLQDLLQDPALASTHRRVRILGPFIQHLRGAQSEGVPESESEASAHARARILDRWTARGMPSDPYTVRSRNFCSDPVSDGSPAGGTIRLNINPPAQRRRTATTARSNAARSESGSESESESSEAPSESSQATESASSPEAEPSTAETLPASQASATTGPLMGSSSQSEETDSSAAKGSDDETDETDEMFLLDPVAAFNQASLEFAIVLSDELEPPGEAQGRLRSLLRDIRELKQVSKSASSRGSRPKASHPFYEDASAALDRLDIVIEGLLERIDDVGEYLWQLGYNTKVTGINFTDSPSFYDRRRAEEVRTKVALAEREIATFQRDDAAEACRGVRRCIRRLRSFVV